MAVEHGDKIRVEYEGRLENGEVFDSSNKTGKQKPLEFVAGENQVIKGFDDAVVGMNEGEEKSFSIAPENAYGEIREDLKREIPKNSLPQDQEPKKGMMLVMSSPQGQQIPAVINDVKDDIVVLDLNHPLAGKKLLFNVKVVGIEKQEKTE